MPYSKEQREKYLKNQEDLLRRSQESRAAWERRMNEGIVIVETRYGPQPVHVDRIRRIESYGIHESFSTEIVVSGYGSIYCTEPSQEVMELVRKARAR